MRWVFLSSLFSLALGSSKICADRVITSSKLVIAPNGVTVNQSFFECASARINTPFKPLTDAEVSLTKRTVDDVAMKRQVNACTLPTPSCICGVACTGTQCFTPRGPVTQTDCAQLGLALISMTGTFLIRPGEGNGFSLGTCTLAVFNNEATVIQEYCDNTLGNVGFLNLNSNCPNKEALCGGGTILGISRFFVEQLSTAAAGG